jgi:PiT family inorganic phosphate transporter
VAQIYSSLILFIGAVGLHWPISTTHTITSAILGAGTNQRFAATNRKWAIRILAVWLLTPLVTGLAAFIFGLASSPLT